MSDEGLFSDIVTEVDKITTFNCPVDDSTVEKNLEKYDKTKSEECDTFVGAMCELDFGNNATYFKSTMDYTTQSFTQDFIN